MGKKLRNSKIASLMHKTQLSVIEESIRSEYQAHEKRMGKLRVALCQEESYLKACKTKIEVSGKELGAWCGVVRVVFYARVRVCVRVRVRVRV